MSPPIAPSPTDTGFFDRIHLVDRLVTAANFALDYWWIWPVIAFVLWAALRLRSQHALSGKLDERADAAFADVDALLIERSTLLGNLAEVVRAFAEREHGVIRDVLGSRVDAIEAMRGTIMNNEGQMASVLQNMFTVDEAYPELTSGAHYGRLREDLLRVEDRITAARRFYNLAVEESNSQRRAFPGNLFTRNDSAPVREKFSLGDRRAEFSEPVSITL
jgi:LemA protein